MKCSSGQFRGIVDEIRAALPPPTSHSVTFRRVAPERLDELSACTTKVGRRFVVSVSTALTVEETADAVIHEYAHVLAWRPSWPFMDHNPHWGVCYAEVYRAFHGVR